MKTIKMVNGYSGGCNASHIYCDGETHVRISWVACHHSLDYDDPEDTEYTVKISACDVNEHHDDDTCYDCNNPMNEGYSDCDFYPENIREEREYWYGLYINELVRAFKEGDGSPVGRKIPWTSSESPSVHSRKVEVKTATGN